MFLISLIRRSGRFLLFVSAAPFAAVLGWCGGAPNLLPNAELRAASDGQPAQWTLWAPRPDIAASGEIVSLQGAKVLSLRSSEYASVGKWLNTVPGIEPGKHYRFEVLHQTEGVTSDATSVLAILSWYRGDDDTRGKRELQRDYVLVTGTEGEWVRSARTIQAPADARSVRIELGLRWAAAGSAVYFKDARLTEAPDPGKRMVRVVATRILPDIPTATLAGNTKLMADMFDRVGPSNPDVVVFSENLATRFVRGSLASRAQPIPGPLTEMLSEKAKAFRTYAVATLLESDGKLFHNTAVLIDREGRIVGRYRKVHLTMGETETGLTPGTEYPVYETDFGRVGLLTCWDNWFGESARALRLNGAEMLIMPLAGDGSAIHWEATWKARAIDNGVWFVTSSTVTDSPSRIINPQGEVVADTSGEFGYAMADIDLNQEWRQQYMSTSSYGEPARFLVKERRPDTYGPVSQAHATEAAWTPSQKK